jgi:hypothetical protein
MVMMTIVCHAEPLYPQTLDDGNLVLVDAHMGVGAYADRSSVAVQKYEPPNYQIAINIVGVQFSEEYFKAHQNYLHSPYTMDGVRTECFRYNWDRKSVSHQRYDGTWHDWDINRFNCHADGQPFVPNTAETAFVAAYNMRFYNETMGYNPVLKENYRVISEYFYRILGI